MNKRILSVLLVVALLVAGCIFAVQANEIPDAPAAVTASDFVSSNAKNNVYAASLEMDFSDPNNLPTGCPYCGKTSGITWKALPGSGGNRVISGHYYAASDINMAGNYYVVNYNATLCVHLNGKTIQSNGVTFDVRCLAAKTDPAEYAADGTTQLYNFTPATKGTLNVMGSGTVIGGGTSSNAGYAADKAPYSSMSSGAATVSAAGNVNLCGGIWKHKSTTKKPTFSVNHQAQLTIYEGATLTADEGVKGRNITVESGKLYMYGGIVEKGDVTGQTGADRFGGNIMIKGSGSYSAAWTQQSWFEGGIIRDGKAHCGGNIAIFGLYGSNTLNVRFVNCWIDGGQAVKTSAGADGDGGNLFLQYATNKTTVVRFNNDSKLTVSDGVAEGRGGNLYFYQNLASTQVTTCHMIVQGGDFLNGQANEGGNFYVSGGKGNFYIGGDAYVSGGKALHTVNAETGKVTKVGCGGNLYVASGAMGIDSVVFKEGTADEYYQVPTIIDGYADSVGGNVYLASGNLAFEGGNLVGGEVGGSTLGAIPTAEGYNPTTTAGNVYIAGGTFKMVDEKAKTGFETVVTGGTGENGGNVYMDGVAAVLDIQGGIIEKGYATSRGNNIYLRQGHVKFTGGEIRNNYTVTEATPAETQGFDGNSIYVGAIASTKIAQITLGGNVVLNANDTTSNIYMNNGATGLVVQENFTGDVRVSVAAGAARPTSGYYGYHIGSEYEKTGGSGESAWTTTGEWGATGAYTGKLTMVLGETSNMSTVAIFPEANGTTTGNTHDLVIASVRGTSFDGEVKTQTWYPSAEAAIDGGDDYFAVFTNDTIEIAEGKTAFVNINGKNVTVSGKGELVFYDAVSAKGKVTVTGDVTLVNNHVSGKLTETNSGATYLTVKNGDETFSSYSLKNKLKGVSLRPSTSGIYFRGTWAIDEQIANNVKNYGVIVSRLEQPDANFANNDKMRYTAYTLEDWDGEEKTGVEITNIFEDGEDNAVRGKDPIYAAAYVVVNNGVEDVTIVDAGDGAFSMYRVLDMMEDSEAVWGAYADALNAFYNTWAADLADWEFDRLGK